MAIVLKRFDFVLSYSEMYMKAFTCIHEQHIQCLERVPHAKRAPRIVGRDVVKLLEL